MADARQDDFPLEGAIAIMQSMDDFIAKTPQEEVFWRLIRGRRSIRRYQDRAIPRELLEKLLTAATWAPSAHNRQPWRFCVVTEKPVQEQLSRRMAQRWREDLRQDRADPEVIERRIAISHARITGAGALILAALSMEDMDAYPDQLRSTAEYIMAVQSTALACQNLLLAAHFYGLGACWMCAPLFVPDAVREALSLPASWEPQALITLGYPAEERTKDRAPIESRVLWRSGDGG